MGSSSLVVSDVLQNENSVTFSSFGRGGRYQVLLATALLVRLGELRELL